MTTDENILRFQQLASDPRGLREYIDSVIQEYSQRPRGTHTTRPTSRVPELTITPADGNEERQGSGPMQISGVPHEGNIPIASRGLIPRQQSQEVDNRSRYQELPRTFAPGNPCRTPNHPTLTYNVAVPDSGVTMEHVNDMSGGNDSFSDYYSATPAASIGHTWRHTGTSSQPDPSIPQFITDPTIAGMAGPESILPYYGGYNNADMGAARRSSAPSLIQPQQPTLGSLFDPWPLSSAYAQPASNSTAHQRPIQGQTTPSDDPEPPWNREA